MKVDIEYGFASSPVLNIPQAVWQELQTYVQLCPVEINGFGIIERLHDTQMRLKNVFIFEQSVGPAHVEITQEVMHKHLYEMRRAGVDIGSVRFQWHSHVNMPAYMSGIDMANIESYDSEWVVSMVTNKRCEHETRLDIFRPFRVSSPVHVAIELDRSAAMEEHCRSQMSEKVKGLSRIGAPWKKDRPLRTDKVSTVYVDDFAVGR
jgi:proteasome lid subunit RPN8/RPN11